MCKFGKSPSDYIFLVHIQTLKLLVSSSGVFEKIYFKDNVTVNACYKHISEMNEEISTPFKTPNFRYTFSFEDSCYTGFFNISNVAKSAYLLMKQNLKERFLKQFFWFCQNFKGLCNLIQHGYKTFRLMAMMHKHVGCVGLIMFLTENV